jgi:hypothetical protein
MIHCDFEHRRGRGALIERYATDLLINEHYHYIGSEWLRCELCRSRAQVR